MVTHLEGLQSTSVTNILRLVNGEDATREDLDQAFLESLEDEIVGSETGSGPRENVQNRLNDGDLNTIAGTTNGMLNFFVDE